MESLGDEQVGAAFIAGPRFLPYQSFQHRPFNRIASGEHIGLNVENIGEPVMYCFVGDCRMPKLESFKFNPLLISRFRRNAGKVDLR